METSLDLSRWQEKPHGVAYRRWTILSTGLRQLLKTRIFRLLLILAWTAGLLMAAIGFLFSQSVASGGWLETFAANFGVRAQAAATALGALVLLFPDVCIGGLFTLIFWLQSYVGLGLSLIGLTLIVPRLVTRDRANNALTIYLSRPLTSTDYLLGKLGITVGILVLLWTGPLLAGWLLSMALSSDSDFLFYSSKPLLHALTFNGLSLVVLAAISLGVSAINRSSRNTIILWIGLTLIAGVIAQNRNAPDWLKRSSFTRNLAEVRQDIFRLDEAFIKAGTELPLVNRSFANSLTRSGQKARATDATGALTSLGIMVVLSSFVFLRKLRPE